MPYKSIIQEVERLKRVSGRLDLLANKHPSVTDALLPLSAGILRIATVLEVLVLSRSGTPKV